MQAGLVARILAADADPDALQVTPVAPRRPRRKALIFLVGGLITYLLGLLLTIPAGVVIHEHERLKVGGTIWNGEGVLASTLRIDWSVAPLASLANLGYTAEWHMTGGSTDLAGDVIRRGGAFTLANVSGQIDGTLLAALAPNMPFACTFTGDLRLERARLGGEDQEVAGRVETGPVNCAAVGLAALPARWPGLSGEFVPVGELTSGFLASGPDGAKMMELRLTRDGKLSVWPTAAAVQTAPFLAGKRFDTRID